MARSKYLESQPSRRFPEAFFLKDFSDASWQSYRKYCHQIALIIPPEAYASVNTNSESGIAWVNYSLKPNQHGALVKNLSILVNEQMYLLDGEDNRDLIPITIEHEASESWVEIWQDRLRNRSRRQIDPAGLPHQMAVLAEFRLAQQMGVAERYLQLTKRWSLQMDSSLGKLFYAENESAYHAIISGSTR